MAVLAAPGAALAGTVTAGTFTAAPGEKNDVRFDAFPPPPVATIVDDGAPLVVGPGCTDGTPVTCGVINSVLLHLGNRADRGFASASTSAAVYGEQGDDVLHADAEFASAYGGLGDDSIAVSGNQVFAHGGRGDDTLEGPFQRGVDLEFWGEAGRDTLIERSPATSHCSMDGGRGADRLLGYFCTQRGGPGRDVMTRQLDIPAGGATYGDRGGDIMVGGLGPGSFDGGPGNDFIQAAVNGLADTIVCGAGKDIVRANAVDTVADDCEHVTRVEPPA